MRHQACAEGPAAARDDGEWVEAPHGRKVGKAAPRSLDPERPFEDAGSAFAKPPDQKLLGRELRRAEIEMHVDAGPQVGYIIPFGDAQGYLNLKVYKVPTGLLSNLPFHASRRSIV